MPTYDYRCAACGNRFELVHGVHGAGPDVCPSCGVGPVTKAITAPAVHFKGSGWAKKERRASTSSGSRSGGGTADDDGGKTDDKGGKTDDKGGTTPASDPPTNASESKPAATGGGSKATSTGTTGAD